MALIDELRISDLPEVVGGIAGLVAIKHVLFWHLSGPSGQHGGNLGQIARGDTVPEFERAIFRLDAHGILRDLVRTRHGFHIVAVDKSIPGKTIPFEAVRGQIAERLKAGVEAKALRQYVSILVGQAEIAGVELTGTRTPLVQ